MKKIVLLAAHITEVPGPVQSLAQYFEGERIDFYKMYFPIDGAKVYSSSFFRNNKLIEKKETKTMGYPRYVWDFLNTLLWLKRIPGPIDKVIGTNCLAVLPFVLVKRFLGIKKVIYFNSDFSRRRFKNPLKNKLYVFLDQFCAVKSDIMCCNTKRTIGARVKEGIDPKKIIFTPNGVFLKAIGKLSLRQKEFEKKILFIGYISEERGLQNIIGLLSDLNLHLDLIGSGSYESQLKTLVHNLGIDSKVSFLGLKTHEEVISYLKKFSGFGLAPYTGEKITDWIWYCDPVKVKEYLACLVPVIISNVPEIADLIEKKKIGFVYQSEQEATRIIKKIADLSEGNYVRMLKNIEKIRRDFDLSLIYKKI